MSLYEIAESGLARHEEALLADLGLREREDLQRLIRDDIGVLDDDLLVIAEEFRQWEDARRRIDLLAVDKTGCLVVIELKRDNEKLGADEQTPLPEGLALHALRRTCASVLVALGKDPRYVMAQLGHTDPRSHSASTRRRRPPATTTASGCGCSWRAAT
jgi:integrase